MPNSYLDTNGLKHYTDKLKQELQANASGVTSFNGRKGEVLPVTNDYSVSMISGAVPETRTINGKPLSTDLTLTTDDIGITASIKSVSILGDASRNCVAIGDNSSAGREDSISIGRNAACGSNSIAIGTEAFCSGEGISIGYNSNASKNHSISIGTKAAAMARNSIAIGYNAAVNSNDPNSVFSSGIAIGVLSNSIGCGISIGDRSFASNQSVTIGVSSNCESHCSVCIGTVANIVGNDSDWSISILGNVSSIYSTAVGLSATCSEKYSSAFGASASASGNMSLAIGYSADAFFTRSVAIGPFASCSEQNTIQLGDSANLSKLSCKVALSVTSDERDKTDITPIGDGAVEFLNRIKAIRYVFNGRELYIPEDENLSDVDRANKSKYGMCSYDKEAHALGTKKGERVRVGVLAQEVQKALQEVYGDKSYANLVDDNFFDLDPSTIPEGVENKLSLTYENFIPFLIKAVQELSEKNKDLELRIQALESAR